MKIKIFKSLLAIACLLGSTNMSAYDFEVDGIYYNVVSLSELTCKVVKGSEKYEGDIVIPATVNYANRTLTVIDIASQVFRNCSNLTGITIPNTISSIGDEMFFGCTKLERVTIEDGDTVLECGYGRKDEIPSNVTAYYYRGAFYDCPIIFVYLGRNISYKKVYGSSDKAFSPFYAIKTIKDITIGNSVTSIGSDAFGGCIGLTNLTIGNSVTSIGSYAFQGCSGLTNLTIGNSVTSIGSYAFQGCRGLTSVTMGSSVTEIGDHAFWNCSGLTSVTIPNSVTSIGSDAFKDCIGLTNLTIGNSVTKIGSYAFQGCSGLTSVTIPNSVTSIGSYAFRDCSRLTSVTIGNSITSIGSSAFSGCDALATLYSLNTTPPSASTGTFTNNHYMTLNVYVPKEALEAYQSANVWKDFWNLQGFDPTGIESVKSEGKNGNNVYYDLNGNRLDAPKKGLNIINGKKVIVK